MKSREQIIFNIVFKNTIFLAFLSIIILLPILDKYKNVIFELFVVVLILNIFIFNFHKSICISILSLSLLSFVMVLILHNETLFVYGIKSKINFINIYLFILICYFLILINLLITSYRIYRQKEPELIYSSPVFRLVYNVEKIFYKGNIFLILFLYLIIIIITIYSFAKVYEYITLYEDGQLLQYTTSISQNYTKGKVTEVSDCIYFSSLTFYTVGYGDIVPVGYHLKFIVQLEVFIGNLLNVVLIGLILNFVNSKITKSKF
ncbi:Ion channel [Alkalithermobacter thermoalcaliphilus JW-YL-7 = DSM 7308]|uniref:Ion channel n=1 Tax=Alkalithermobacter thermoalcaliphilus JW-YL-7 = DSM 7308 TaxID=1121328 RepID=A0A150FP43_CLOPD|nr:Ion transport 2 domain protein [[Clostridium] paradoxum JW-YL-7 = DSM 7308]SHK52597.1 Ion channel [[Clostridium] paradoxum JW-YL-7 = DSM 7308]